MPKRPVIALLAVAAALAFYTQRDGRAPGAPPGVDPAPVPSTSSGDDRALQRAIATRAQDVPVTGHGTVVRVLADDVDGSRHQRFILRLPSGGTLLVAHNIDLAPRLASLGPGERVEFSGEYVWNPRGGVIHWTHHDPAGRHPGGWLRHDGAIAR